MKIIGDAKLASVTQFGDDTTGATVVLKGEDVRFEVDLGQLDIAKLLKVFGEDVPFVLDLNLAATAD